MRFLLPTALRIDPMAGGTSSDALLPGPPERVNAPSCAAAAILSLLRGRSQRASPLQAGPTGERARTQL
jgi:hypothetical protein